MRTPLAQEWKAVKNTQSPLGFFHPVSPGVDNEDKATF